MKFEDAVNFCDEFTKEDLTKIAQRTQRRIAKTKKPKKKQKSLRQKISEFNFRRLKTQGFQLLFLMSLILTLLFQHYEPFNGFVNSSFIEPSMDTAVSLKDKVTQSVSQAFVPTKPTTTPTTTPTTAPAVAIASPTPVPQKCPIVSRLGSYAELVEFCNKNSPFLNASVTMKGDNNPLDQDQKLVHTNESGYDLKFEVVESKPLPKKKGEEQRYLLSIDVINEQLQQVCSRYWYKNTTGKIVCVMLPKPTYQTPWGLVGPGEEKTFTTTVVEGGALEISAQSVDTERYQKEIQSYENNSDWTRIPPEIGEEGLRY